jgi:hypothetical protein
MNNDPIVMAADLIERYGLEGAKEAVREEITTAHGREDNYSLSVWREVRRTLVAMQNDAAKQED